MHGPSRPVVRFLRVFQAKVQFRGQTPQIDAFTAVPVVLCVTALVALHSVVARVLSVAVPECSSTHIIGCTHFRDLLDVRLDFCHAN